MARLPWLVLAFLWPSASGFPVESLTVDGAFLDKLKVSGPGANAAATAALLPQLQRVFAKAEYAISVEKGDVVVQASFPDTQVDDDCSHKIEAEHPKATGALLGSSFLKFGVAKISWHGVTVFADAEVDATLDINTDVCVRVGKKIFGHHCSQIARKTVGIDVLSDGKNGVGVNMTAYNARVTRVNGTWSLVFNFHASVVGKVLSWSIEKVHADNCKIKILGIEIASVCGTIERHVKDKAQRLTDQVTQVTAPSVLKRLEQKINTAIGSEVTIPLRIGEELVI
eukprot:CAMPEP_0171235234 /NCGR_PEP_ID=MMETSP0790-20130122/41841_1 /TAXON_ID=2925 /ORGANISM="Alexandrium catenella, Strain OF101" /LENGTH=282 /DNA_ID=CAMNT_0011701539 /DNA_START=1 /DNA_END=849 /DNA_ORIENTATION=-